MPSVVPYTSSPSAVAFIHFTPPRSVGRIMPSEPNAIPPPLWLGNCAQPSWSSSLVPSSA